MGSNGRSSLKRVERSGWEGHHGGMNDMVIMVYG